MNLSPENHNDLSIHNLQENQKELLPKNCPKDTKSTPVNSAETLVFDHEKEMAIKELTDFLREKSTGYCVGMAKLIKSGSIESLALKVSEIKK